MKRIITVFLCMVMIVIMSTGTVFAASDDRVLTLPEDDGTGYPVTGITDNYNNDDEVIKVIVPENILRLGERAFWGCSNLNQIKLHNQIQKIGKQAFESTAYYADADNWENGVLYIGDCLIKAKPDRISDTYEIRNGTRLIADGAFDDCKNLSTIILPNTIEYVGTDAFTDTAFFNNQDNWKNGALLLNYLLIAADKDYVGIFDVPDGIRTIADNAFSNCSEITSVTTPDSLKHIGDNAFWDCQKLKTVSLGKSVETLGRGPFRMCRELQTITVHNENAYFSTADGVLYDKQLSEVIRCPEKLNGNVNLPHSVRKINAYAFECCRELAHVEFPNECVFIGDSAFSECENLKDVSIPKNMEYIDKYAFSYCNSIESISVPDNVCYLGKYAFTCCMNLKEAKIGSGVTEIAEHLFDSCEKLNYVTLGNAVEKIAGNAFEKTKYISNIANYKNGLLINSEKYLIKVAKDVTNCSIHTNVSLIADDAFEYPLEEGIIREIHIPSSVKRVGRDAFSGIPTTVKIYYDDNTYNLQGISLYDLEHLNLHTTDSKTVAWSLVGFAGIFIVLILIVFGMNYYRAHQDGNEETEKDYAK